MPGVFRCERGKGSHRQSVSGYFVHLHPQAVAAPPSLLTVAGFDPSCGAGIAADLKTFAAYGCYGVAAITSLTVQNTQGVEAVHNTPSAELREQLDVLAKDCEISAVKVGMLGNRGNAVVVAEFLDAHKFAHVVHDPVLRSSSNSELLESGGIKFLSTEMLKRSSVITPNVAEAEVLSGMSIKEVADMEAAWAAKRSRSSTPTAPVAPSRRPSPRNSRRAVRFSKPPRSPRPTS